MTSRAPIRLVGLTRVRNERALIVDALDHLASFCTGGIFVYDDCSTDGTAELCETHAAVRRVVRGAFWDANRGRADYATRASLLAAAQASEEPADWFVYIDADERIEYDWSRLGRLDPDVLGVRMKLFDFYITPDDVDRPYWQREWIGPEYRPILMAFRNLPTLSYSVPNQRAVELGQPGRVADEGWVRHYGKAVSVGEWEETCDFYATYFPAYAAKWRARRGRALHAESDFGRPLVRWSERESDGVPLDAKDGTRVDDLAKHTDRAGALRVLVSTHHLLDYTGTETYTLTLAEAIRRAGHEVVVHTRYRDKTARRLHALGIRVVDDIDAIAGERFDVAHVHHAPNVAEVRYVFPTLPIVAVSHGVLPFLEQPLPFDVGVARHLGVSEEVCDHLIAAGVPAERVAVSRNLVDAQKFTPTSRIADVPRRALVVSGYLDEARERIVREALAAESVAVRFVGGRFGEVDYDLLPLLMNDADIVFSLGRGAVEAMCCGRVPVVFDYRGGDGLLTPETFAHSRRANFSGRGYRREFDVASLRDELRRYRPEHGEALRALARADFDVHERLPGLLEVYREAARAHVPPLAPDTTRLLGAFVGAIRHARGYAYAHASRQVPTPPPALTSAFTDAEGRVTPDVEVALRDQLWLDPTSAAAHRELGLLHRDRGHIGLAVRHLHRAGQLDPRDEVTRAAQAELLTQVSGELTARDARHRTERAELIAAVARRHEALEALKAAELRRRARRLARTIRLRGHERVVVYGAGDVGRVLAAALGRAGVRVAAFVDRTPTLQGTCIDGVRVEPLDAVIEPGVVFAIGSVASVAPIVETIVGAGEAAGVAPTICAIGRTLTARRRRAVRAALAAVR
ncbi:MAG: glycosyltransferase family 2 protein [Vicinamibacterales bacterium]